MKGAREVPKPGRKAVTVRLADVEPEEVSWLWHPYIPLGKLTLLEGDPGLGKTFISLTLCAIITRGWPLPSQDGKPGGEHEPANVLYLSAEDGLGDTLRPRLDAAGADVSRVMALTGWQETDESGKPIEGVVTLGDKEILEQALKAHHPKLVVIDPLQAYLGADADMNKANEVRPRLAMLSALAEKYECAVLCIRHWTKSEKGKSGYRGLGSIDFTAAARSVLAVGEREGERLLAQVKSNLAPFGKSQRYRLADNLLEWCGVSNVTAEDLNIQVRPESDSALEDAMTFLRDFLKDSPQTAQAVTQAASREDISKRTLYRAKKELGVLSEREATGEERGKGRWLWRLPDQGCQPQGERLGNLEHLKEKPDADDKPLTLPSKGDGNVKQSRQGQENFNSFNIANTSNRGGTLESEPERDRPPLELYDDDLPASEDYPEETPWDESEVTEGNARGAEDTEPGWEATL